MTSSTNQSRKNEKGFTLVELAIVMIIIGLLIGGILKGQELIANAQVASTVSQVKGIDAAVSTFRDSYNAFPGDMATARTRISNCTADPCTNGDGDSRLEVNPNNAAQAGEQLGFWAHMAAADLLTGVDGTQTVQFGSALPAANVGGGYVAGFTANGAITGYGGPAARAGHYIVLRSSPTAAADAANAILSAAQAARIDQKADDGAPNGGTIRAIGSTGGGVGNCASAATVAGVYNEALDGISCSLAVRIQG